MDLDWLIVGGGIHGVHIAGRLLKDGHIPPSRLRIVDPGERLLQRWRKCTEITGMKFLRSPAVHHLDLDPWALKRFAGKSKKRKRGLFAPPYDRPSLKLFNDHCDSVIKDCGLNALHMRARVVNFTINCSGVTVELSDGQNVRAHHVVLAMGSSEQPEWPDWAPKGENCIQHVFEPGFDAWPSSQEKLIVVGGGVSAGQVALRLVKEGHGVHLVSRHGLRQHQFDSDPGWLGPKFMTIFDREQNPDRRRALITQGRNRGSVPPRVYRGLRRAINKGQLDWHESAVDSIDLVGEGVAMKLGSDVVLEADRVFLATGFASHRPGGALIDRLVDSESLECAECGYPIVDESLRWHPRVYVSGPLAELELGPTARNIAGARRAGERVLQAAIADGMQQDRKAS